LTKNMPQYILRDGICSFLKGTDMTDQSQENQKDREQQKTLGVKLVIRGGTLATRIEESVEARLASAFIQANASGSYLLKVRQAHPNPHNISGIKVGKRLIRQSCKLYVCETDSILECDLGPKPLHTNSHDTASLLAPILGEMPEESVPTSSRKIGSVVVEKVVTKLRKTHGTNIFPTGSVVEAVPKRIQGKARSGFIGTMYRDGLLVRVSPTETRLGNKEDICSAQKKRRKSVGAPSEETFPKDDEVVAAARNTYGSNVFGKEELISIVKKLSPHFGKHSLGGYLAGLRKRKVLNVSGRGADRKYIVPSASATKLQYAAQIPMFASQLKSSADEYGALQKRKEELQKELVLVEEKLTSLHESVVLFEALRKALL